MAPPTKILIHISGGGIVGVSSDSSVHVIVFDEDNLEESGVPSDERDSLWDKLCADHQLADNVTAWENPTGTPEAPGRGEYDVFPGPDGWGVQAVKLGTTIYDGQFHQAVAAKIAGILNEHGIEDWNLTHGRLRGMGVSDADLFPSKQAVS